MFCTEGRGYRNHRAHYTLPVQREMVITGFGVHYTLSVQRYRAGHNFRCPLISPLSVDPLDNGTALILHFENVNLTEERLLLGLFKASTLKFDFVEFLKT